MTDFVYRLSSTTSFVYRIFDFTIHKLLCDLQNIHKLSRIGTFNFNIHERYSHIPKQFK